MPGFLVRFYHDLQSHVMGEVAPSPLQECLADEVEVLRRCRDWLERLKRGEEIVVNHRLETGSSGDSSSGDTILNFSGAIRSIFSICNALRQGGLLTLLDVPPSICYPSGRRWQRRGPKPGEQRNLDLRIGRERASRHGDCQHHGGRGPAVRGKVNPGEVLIKVVIKNKPKMLTGLNQKGKWSGTGAPNSPVADGAPSADRHDLTLGLNEKVNEVTPLSPREGRLPAKEANGTAGKG